MPQTHFGNARRVALRGSSPGYSVLELMMAMAITVTTAAFVVPFTRSTLNSMNLTADARNVQSSVSLAKMRAAAFFTKARLRVDLANRRFWVERWRKTGPAAWVVEGEASTLSNTVNFGFSNLGAPPPNTQAAIGQAPLCQDNAGVNIAGTSCIVFNSRGIPVDNLNVPFAGDAVYLNDGSVVFGVTASPGGHVRLWRTNITGPQWKLH